MTQPVDPQLWNQKAVAFAVRSHRQLWGRNNEDPLAWIFQHGFKNAFMKQMMVGWNKHDQSRDPQDWGLPQALESDPDRTGEQNQRLFLPAGLVIPWIRDKELLKITVYRHQAPDPGNGQMIQGSLPSAMILGNPGPRVAVVPHIMDGLWLCQEAGDNLCVVIPQAPEISLDATVMALIRDASNLMLLCRKESSGIWQGFLDDLPYKATALTYSCISQVTGIL
ncbi:MAG: hypothetical protein V1793_17510 [Pseudomonadota bacterium]